jgi:hypothetical protein
VEPFIVLVRALHSRNVRFVLIGVAGANYFAQGASTIFTTQDRDLFLAADPENVLNAWTASEAVGLTLWAGTEPLDYPRDRRLMGLEFLRP